MWRIGIAIILIVNFFSSVSAQITLDEIRKGKFGKIEGIENEAETDTTKVAVREKECDIITHAISSELSIIRQQYRLERDGDYYGKNNEPYYGETYSLGIKVTGGMYLLDEVVEPWKRDADYQRVNASKNYKPVWFWSYQRALSDSVYKAVELELGTRYTAPANKEKSLYWHEDKKSDFGLYVDNTFGHKSGFMLWAYSGTDVQDSAMVVKLRQSSLKMDVKADSTLVAMSPNEPEKIIGGLYVTPKYERGGRVLYMLVGVAVRMDDSKWALQMLATENETGKKGDAVTNPDKSDKKKEGKKSESTDSIDPTPIK